MSKYLYRGKHRKPGRAIRLFRYFDLQGTV